MSSSILNNVPTTPAAENSGDNSSATDRDLKRRVISFLASQHVPGLRRVSVEARQGMVTLSGSLGSYYEKQLSQACGRRVAGVVRLIDSTLVGGSPRASSQGGPAWRTPAVLTTALLSLALIGSLGCGKEPSGPPRVPVVPLQGSVTWDGKPLAGALVAFHPQTPNVAEAVYGRAQTAGDGTFSPTSYDAGDGLAPGKYKVTVEWYPVQGDATEAVPGPNALPERYGRPEQTDLVVDVAEGSSQLPTLTLRR